MIYLIGSMRNPKVPKIARRLRDAGMVVFDDWYAPGPEADEKWQEYETARGRTYAEALTGEHARNVFEFDCEHLLKAEAVVLVMPAGKSAHLELGWMLGRGKPGYILLEPNPLRFDIMHRFATGLASTVDELIEMLEREIQ